MAWIRETHPSRCLCCSDQVWICCADLERIRCRQKYAVLRPPQLRVAREDHGSVQVGVITPSVVRIRGVGPAALAASAPAVALPRPSSSPPSAASGVAAAGGRAPAPPVVAAARCRRVFREVVQVHQRLGQRLGRGGTPRGPRETRCPFSGRIWRWRFPRRDGCGAGGVRAHPGALIGRGQLPQGCCRCCRCSSCSGALGGAREAQSIEGCSGARGGA